MSVILAPNVWVCVDLNTKAAFSFSLFEILVGAGFVHILVGGSGYVQGFLGLLQCVVC